MVCVNGDGIRRLRVSIGDRIEAALGEGMAAAKPPQRQPRASNNAETHHRDIRILRAGRQVKALRRAEGMQHRRDHGPVDPEGDANGGAGLGWVVLVHFGKT